MKRRSFLTTALSSASAATVVTIWPHAWAKNTTRYDLIIIGAGTAGLPAAIFAARRGAQVLLIDSASDIGGTLHMANGQISAAGTRTQVAKGIQDSPDAHYEDVLRLSHGLADHNILRRTADEAPDTVNWLLDAGLTPLADHPVTGDSPGRNAYNTPRYLWAKDEGKAILSVIRSELTPHLKSGRITLKLNMRVIGLLSDKLGAIEGIAAVGGFKARGCHVVLTSGGYAMNPNLFEQLSGFPAYAATSYPFSQGQGLDLARSAGGVLRGGELHRPGTGSILTSEHFPAKVYARFITSAQQRLPWEIWVNNYGQRYVREDEPLAYERERALVKQDKLRYQIIFDSTILDHAPPGIKDFSSEKIRQHFDFHPMFHRADTLELLAAATSIDAAGLMQTIAQYNTGVANKNDAFGRQHLPLPILNPPFYAITHLGHSATSAAGVLVDSQLRVIKSSGEPVPNLYAAGEVLGSGSSLGDAFVPGMMLTPALALGRWLGMSLRIGS